MANGSKDEIKLMKRRALTFLDLAKYSLLQENYDIAAFNAEQAAQLALKATLLDLIGDYPRSHSIVLLMKELSRLNKSEIEAFLQNHKSGLHVLEDAYLTSRYFYKIFDKDDGEYLVSLAEEVIKFCERLRSSMGKN